MPIFWKLLLWLIVTLVVCGGVIWLLCVQLSWQIDQTYNEDGTLKEAQQ